MIPKELIGGINQLLSLPDVVIRVTELLESNSATVDDIGSVITHDPALSAQLLKLVNSAFYGFPSQIDSVSRAVNLIGTTQLRSLIFASSAAETFSNIPTELVDMNSFWHRSVYCGLIAKKLACATQKTKGETQFLTGLLHDIGRLVLMTRLPSEYKELLQTSKACDTKPAILELQRFGFSAAELGAILLEHWRLPPQLWLPVKFQHNPEASNQFTPDCHLLHLAIQITNCMEPEIKGDEAEPNLQQLESIAIDAFALDREALYRIAMDANLEALDVLSIINPGAASIY